MSDFQIVTVTTWENLLGEIKERGLNEIGWVFRGQTSDWPLQSTLSQACEDLEIDPQEIPGLEEKMIRDFRRNYTGSDLQYVWKDTLFCLSLMRHHFAPSRLLDFTYSIYIATFFALEKKAEAGDGIIRANPDERNCPTATVMTNHPSIKGGIALDNNVW